jgi:hypothetical protein
MGVLTMFLRRRGSAEPANQRVQDGRRESGAKEGITVHANAVALAA